MQYVSLGNRLYSFVIAHHQSINHVKLIIIAGTEQATLYQSPCRKETQNQTGGGSGGWWESRKETHVSNACYSNRMSPRTPAHSLHTVAIREVCAQPGGLNRTSY